jgi:hypothetical protein
MILKSLRILRTAPRDAKSFGIFGGGGRFGSLIVGIAGRSGRSGSDGIGGITGRVGRVRLSPGARGSEKRGRSGSLIGLRLN